MNNHQAKEKTVDPFGSESSEDLPTSLKKDLQNLKAESPCGSLGMKRVM